jgi:hypothetical protein
MVEVNLQINSCGLFVTLLSVYWCRYVMPRRLYR